MRSLKSLKSLTISSGLIGIITIAACASPAPETKPAPPNPFTSSTSTSEPKANASLQANPKANEKANDQTSGKANQGGQVVEVGAYHLELVTINEDSGIHIDLFLQNGTDHSPIPDAKVSAQVQLPNGTKKSLDLLYKVDGQHYGAELSETIAGEYKVVVLSEIKGEKINGRFSFKR